LVPLGADAVGPRPRLVEEHLRRRRARCVFAGVPGLRACFVT
jgi:hypothetical protein